MGPIETLSAGWTEAEARALDRYSAKATNGVAARIAASVIRMTVAIARRVGPRPDTEEGARPPARVLLVRLDELGDVILGSALITALRAAWPSAHITLVAQPGPAQAFAADPALDAVVTFAPPRRKWLRPIMMPIVARAFCRRLPRPDIAIQPRWGVDGNFAAWIAYFSGAPRRVGFASAVTPRKQVFNAGLDALYTHVIDVRNIAHEATRVNDVLNALGIPPGPLTSHVATKAVADQGVWRAGAGARIVVGVGGGHSPLKAWPAEHFAELMSRVAAAAPAQFVLLGTPHERATATAAADAATADVVDRTGRTSLAEAASIIAGAGLYVGNDTGLLHLAAACGVPTVGIFGPSLPLLFAPLGDRAAVIWNALPCNPYARAVRTTGAEPPAVLTEGDRCTSCIVGTHACMRALPVDVVVRACLDRIDPGSAAG